MTDSAETVFPDPLSPDECEGLALDDREADVVDDVQVAGGGGEVDVQPGDLEQRRRHRRAASSASRTSSWTT